MIAGFLAKIYVSKCHSDFETFAEGAIEKP